MDIVKPSLTEITTKYYIRHSLKQTRIFKDKYISIVINISMFITFFLLVTGLLYYKYKGKLTPDEKYNLSQKKKQYIFEKLHSISYEKQKQQQNMITNLPSF